MLRLIVDSQRLRLQQELIAGESVNVLTCKALFRSSDWGGMHKYLHLRQGDTAKDWILINDEITADQHVDLTAGEWELWLHGTEYDGELVKRRITTNVCKLRVDDTGAIDGEFFPSITPNIGEQLIAKAEALLEKVEALDVSAIEAAGERALEGIGGAKDQAERAVEEKGAQTLASIPEDYTQLAGDVTALNDNYGKLTTACIAMTDMLCDYLRIHTYTDDDCTVVEAMRDTLMAYIGGDPGTTSTSVSFANGVIMLNGTELAAVMEYSGIIRVA